MTTPCELTAPEREHYEETVRALERRIDEVCAERDEARKSEKWLRERFAWDRESECGLDALVAYVRRRMAEVSAEGGIYDNGFWCVDEAERAFEVDAESFAELAGRAESAESDRDALADRLARVERGLRAVEAHHLAMNDAAGRPRTNSTTLRIVGAALAGCDHLAGDVCRRCFPSLPLCARHPDADVRRFGPLWRCGECGEEATLMQHARALSGGKGEER